MLLSVIICSRSKTDEANNSSRVYTQLHPLNTKSRGRLTFALSQRAASGAHSPGAGLCATSGAHSPGAGLGFPYPPLGKLVQGPGDLPPPLKFSQGVSGRLQWPEGLFLWVSKIFYLDFRVSFGLFSVVLATNSSLLAPFSSLRRVT